MQAKLFIFKISLTIPWVIMLAHNVHSDTKLLQSLKSGDQSAFNALYELYAASLTGYAASRVASLEEARDIIHDLFVYIWDERENIAITTSFKSFLFAAVRYRIIDHIRKNITRREYAEMTQRLTNDFINNAEDELTAKNLNQTIELAVNNLPLRTKEIYRLSRHHQLAVKEIACQLHLSEQTVKNQLTTALSYLRASLERLAILGVWVLLH
ncbi:RNA polymerase sigma-70 factor [Agriterribacter sp.]|uniref:RNA polymerase sigma factor n=1 Tax=Agriterribacter sp. TaxID=2821509 RepID=UPI002B9DD9CD|nr:RNA polymerase sigma-70 factor [Agriterribacter sp.]HTN08003.1 RNA polymerase sigma-70 factor [Agriterribacter sp.]